MPKSASPISPAFFVTFGEFLRYLRRRAGLTQLALSIAVGYSEAQINRLEKNLRAPDPTVIAARFIEALQVEDEPELVARILELAVAAQGQRLPKAGSITIARTVTQELTEEIELFEEPTAHNLPRRLTSFIGREQEMEAVHRLLTTSSLVTLTGAGGCGKTSLAVETARLIAQFGIRRQWAPSEWSSQPIPHFKDGVWLVELASVADPTFVPRAVLGALVAEVNREQPALETLVHHLRAKTTLLVLDNCEHVVEAAAHLADMLLHACPHLRILATSRETLNIPGEIAFTVPSLAFPNAPELPALDVLPDYAAIQLFVERAQAALPSFRLTDQNAPAAARICQRLDGIPLAIELAAGRVRLLQVEEIATRLTQSFDLLTGGSRTALPRQQTLRAAIEWSYGLLPAEERALLRRLSVFAGGFTVDAAEAVANAEYETRTAERAAPGSALDLLTQLVNKSLVVADRRPGVATRCRLLEMIRQYASDQLVGEEQRATRHCHLTFYERLVEEAMPKLRCPDQLAWFERLDIEHDNLRAALHWALATDAAAALRLVVSLDHFWSVRGFPERREWLARCMALPDAPPTRAYAQALSLEAREWGEGRDDERGAALFAQSMRLCQELHDPVALAFSLECQGSAAWWRDLVETRQLFERSLALYQELGDLEGMARVHAALGELEQVRGDHRSIAVHHFQASLRLSRELGDLRGIANALIHLGDVAIEQGDVTTAEAYGQEGVALARTLGYKVGVAFGLMTLAVVNMNRGDFAQAVRLGEESVLLNRDFGNTDYLGLSFYWLGVVLRFQGDLERAQTVFEECLAVGRSLADQSDAIVSGAFYGLGEVARLREDYAAARAWHRAALRADQSINSRWSIPNDLDAMAALAAAQAYSEVGASQVDSAHQAACLWGAADALRQAAGTAMLPIERAARDSLIVAMRRVTNDNAFATAWGQGQAMTTERAVAYALEHIRLL